MDISEPRWIEALEGEWDGPLRLRVRGRSMWPTLQPGDQVTAEPVTAEDLRRGDWVLLQGRDGVFLHRFLGFAGDGRLLTKGDAHRSPDHPWSPEALLGRVVALSRQGQPVSVSSSLRERARTALHRLMAAAWSLLRRIGLALILLGLAPVMVWAAVTLVSFEAFPEGDVIHITWETASEVNMLGFYIQRAPEESGEYARISELVWAEGDLFGAIYAYDDEDVIMGQTYYYRLEAVEVDDSADLYGPISATLPLPATETPTPSSTPTIRVPPNTSTPTPTPSPTPTIRVLPNTSTSTPTPTETPRPTTTSARRPTPVASPTAAPSPTSTPTGTPVPTITPTARPTGTRPPTTAPTGTPASTAASTEMPSSTPALALTRTSTPASVARVSDATPAPSSFPSTSASDPARRSVAMGAFPSWWWALILALVGVGSGLVLWAGWRLWRARGKE